ncbi:MAG: DUF4375 domain-containing protein [Bacteroidota bacterium]
MRTFCSTLAIILSLFLCAVGGYSCKESPQDPVSEASYEVKDDYRADMDLYYYRSLYPLPTSSIYPFTLTYEQVLLPPIFEEMSKGGVNTVYPQLSPGQQALYKLTELRAFMEDVGIIAYLKSPAGSKTHELMDILAHIQADQIMGPMEEVLATWEVSGWKNKVLPNIRMESEAIDLSGISTFENFYFENQSYLDGRMLTYLKEHPEEFIQLNEADSTIIEQTDTL